MKGSDSSLVVFISAIGAVSVLLPLTIFCYALYQSKFKDPDEPVKKTPSAEELDRRTGFIKFAPKRANEAQLEQFYDHHVTSIPHGHWEEQSASHGRAKTHKKRWGNFAKGPAASMPNVYQISSKKDAELRIVDLQQLSTGIGDYSPKSGKSAAFCMPTSKNGNCPEPVADALGKYLASNQK